MRMRVILLVIAMWCAFLAWSGVALAASAQDIYDDYMTNGYLTGTYTDAELQAFLGDASLHQYGDPTIISSIDTAVSSLLTSESATGGRHDFPFTGAQLALMALAALALIGAGVGLRRLARSRS